MTEFILGKACADVSVKLRQKLIDLVINGEKALIIVPDQFEFETEKALYRACASKGKAYLFSNISVRTFSKLSDEIINRFAGEKKPADDITKDIIMYRAISEIHDELEAFRKIALKAGFAHKMTSTVATFKGCGISAATLSQTVDAVKEDFRDSSPALFAKLGDISRIYSAYDALLSESYSDKLDSTMNAAKLAVQNGYFRGENVFCDGFSDFSGSQIEFLYSIIDLAENVTFAFTTDTSENSRDIFATINKTISLLAEHSENADIPVKGINELSDENIHFERNSLADISEGVFGGITADCSGGDVRIIKADDIYAEADFIAAEIRRLTTEEGMRYKDIAVLSADPAEYRSPVESAFDKYEIPIFCDIPESILHMPLVNLVLSLLNVLRSFTVENVLSYVKTGFIQKSDKKPLTMRDINDLEEYIYKWDVKNNDLKAPFPGENGKNPRAEEIRKDIIPPLMQLKSDIKGCTGAEITKLVCDFMFDTIGVQRAVAAHCKKAGSELLTDSDKEMISSYQTLWNTLLQIFEGLYQGLEGFKISIDDYYGLVRDICTSASLAKPPQVLDSVLAGDISRTRTKNTKVVFITGACYGKFPAEEIQTGIFSEHETELLGESIIKLGMNRRERYCYERYLAYIALSVPTHKLYITYPMLDSTCAKMSPSDVVTELTGNFNITEERTSDFGDDFYCRSRRAAQQRYASVSYTDSERRSTLKAALGMAGQAEFTDMLDRLSIERATAYKHKLDPETAEALFRSNTFSATKLEKLNQCRFEYFCANGLRIKERNKKGYSNLEVGNAVHYVLQKMLEKYCNSMDVFITLTRPVLAEKARFYLDEYKENALGGDFAKNLRFGYLYKNLTTSAVDILLLLQAEFAARDYRPKFFELNIGGTSAESPATSPAQPLDTSRLNDAVLSDHIDNTKTTDNILSDTDDNTDMQTLPGSARTSINTAPLSVKIRDDLDISITGIIDRADTFTDKNGNEYIRVVDYKTGSREFSMVNVYYGINTQMLMYLITICEANKELRPGGVSYLPAKITEPVNKRTAAMSLLALDHVQSGMFVSSEATTAELNRYADTMSSLSGAKPEKFIPKEENTLTEEQFREFTEKCLSQTRDVLGKLYDGDIDAIPTVYTEKNTKKKACSYCRFESICGHNSRMEIHAVPLEKEEEKNGEEVKTDEVD